MNKALVIGCSGSGKSTFSIQLGELTGLPVIHLDAHFWKSGWVQPTVEEWDVTIHQLMKLDRYIMDGDYSRTLDKRIVDADTVYFFDYSRLFCLYRVIKRRILNHGKTRRDMAEGCQEKIDLKFLKWIWNYNKRSRPLVLEKLNQIKHTKKVYIFTHPKQVKQYLSDFSLKAF